MVDVEVGAEDGVDRLSRVSRGGQVLEEGALALAPAWDRPLLVVSDAGVDDDPPVAALDDERVNAPQRLSLRVDEVRHHPGDLLQVLLGRLRHDEGEAGKLQLLNAGDANVPDLPLMHERSPSKR